MVELRSPKPVTRVQFLPPLLYKKLGGRFPPPVLKLFSMKLKAGLTIVNLVTLILLVATLILHFGHLVAQNVENLIIIPVAIIATLPVIYESVFTLKDKKLSIMLLASVALAFSILAGEWTSVIFINLMLTMARIFADFTEDKAEHALKSLVKLRPKKVLVKRNGKVEEISISKVQIGDIIISELGKIIPVDGEVVEGKASVDQSSLTGESIPVDKIVGDKVISASVVVSGELHIKAEKIGTETTLEKMIDLVAKSKINKATITTIADKFTNWYVALMLIGAVILYFIFKNVDMVLAVLLVVCADDIAVALPLTFVAAIGHAAKRGVIIKGGDYLEAMHKVKVLIVDKTGTLTYGKLKVDELIVLDGKGDHEILKLVGAACAFSTHPSAKAIMHYIKERGASFVEADHIDEIAGGGIVATLNNEKIVIGKISFLKEKGVILSDEDKARIKKEKEHGWNVTLIGLNNRLVGLFILADEIKPHIKAALYDLKKLGIEKVVMLTGDNERVAKRVADAVGISEYHANLMPEQKLEFLKKYLSEDYKVAMIGDGVNDAAALSLADVGIVMGVIGSDIAVESANIVLMKDDFSKIPEIIRLSRYVMRIAKQDFWMWGIINMAGLFFVFGGVIGVTGAAAYNFLTDFFPILNSMKLFQKHLNIEK